MTETAPDVIGQTLLRAFAQQGLRATLPDPATISVQLPDGSSARADISAWRDQAARGGADRLWEAAAGYAAQAARAFGRDAAQAAEVARGGRVEEGDLRVRLYTEEALGGMRDSLVTRLLAPGLVETVVVDYPDSIMPLDRGRLGDVPEDGVFGAALAHSIGTEQHYAETADVQGVPVTHIGGEHRYVSAHVHVLRRHAAHAPHGALVSFPLPEYVLVHVIGETHVFAAMETLQDLSGRLFESGDKALSPQLYWWRPGPYEELPEEQALRTGLVPDLRPVGVEFDHRAKTLALQSADTNELVELWMRDHHS
jgi:hypothetical protein